ncbi:MAG: HNH endonuclease signature motif containing protein [Methylocella sp.]
MDNRKTITTAARLALWEAHGRKCAYTGEPVAWTELEIDHIIPVKSDAARKTELRGAGIIGADFDINGFENLLPTKAHLNNQKSNFIANERSIVFFLSLAANDINIEDMIAYLRHQSEGNVPLRVCPEIDGEAISAANSQFAAVLMDKPFALGRGIITEVALRNDNDDVTICTTANEFIAAKAAGLSPKTQFDINCYSLADQTSQLLRAVKQSTYATNSEIRTPLCTRRSNSRPRSGGITRPQSFRD